MKVFAVSRVRFAQLLDELTEEQKSKSLFISIHENDPYFMEFRPTTHNYLNLRFDDIEEDLPLLNGQKCVLFDESMAEQIKELLLANLDKIAVFVHCTAGQCRSGAVAEVINDYLGNDCAEFKRDNPQVKPNILVKQILTRILQSQ